MEDISLEPNRHGFVEETHYTIAHSPVPDEFAPRGIGCVLATVPEITEKVVGERRVAVLRDLGTRASEARSAEEACTVACSTLANHDKDIPFALLYLIEPEGKRAQLAGITGVEPGEAASPLSIEFNTHVSGDWPLADTVQRAEKVVVEDLSARFAHRTPRSLVRSTSLRGGGACAV